MTHKKGTSVNERAKKIMGLRNGGKPSTALFFPIELGYVCPICRDQTDVNKALDPSLEWSEYHGFLWCRKCDLDIPSCLCKEFPEPNISKTRLSKRDRIIEATRIFLDTFETVVSNSATKSRNVESVKGHGKRKL